MTWWQRLADELTMVRESIVARVEIGCSRQDVESGEVGKLRRQMHGISAAWKRKYLKAHQ